MKSKLLLSASIVSLTVGLSSGAYANPPNPNNSPTTVNDINSSISGDFVNNSTLGRQGPSHDEVGLYIDDSAEVSGNIINNGNIYGTQTGIKVNESGILDGSIINKGLISANTGSDDYAYGVVMNGRGVSSQDIQNSGHIVASADDTFTGNDPDIEVGATGIYQDVFGAGDISNSGSNSGTITASAHAVARATTGWANASSYATGVSQEATNENEGSTGSASNSFNNSDGSIGVTSWAQAKGDSGSQNAKASATADGYGINQYIYASSDVLDSYKGAASVNNNDGNIDVYAHATATAGNNATEYASATAQSYGVGVHQYVEVPGTASASLTNNDGSITVTSKSYAQGGDALATDGNDYFEDTVGNADAVATASAVGVYQYAQSFDGAASAKATNNNGSIQVTASAQAHAGDTASAYDASAKATSTAYGVAQNVYAGGAGTATIENSGSVTIKSFASAEGGQNFSFNGDYGSGTAAAFASAQATGLYQYVESDGAGLATITNSGNIHVNATGKAFSYGANDATALASAAGVVQFVDSGTSATAKLQNDGTIYAGAKATATVHANTTGNAYASAAAWGVWQSVHDTPPHIPLTATVDNTDSIVAVATAKADGEVAGVGTNSDNTFDVNTGGFQYVLPNNGAFAVFQVASDGSTADLTVTNSGEISATAYGYASGDAVGAADVAAIGVGQVIGADIYGGTDFFNVGTGTALVNNNANGEIYGYAVAFAGGSDAANALASAAGVVQVVAGYQDAYATVVNDGLISAEAYAVEGSNGPGDALARAAGVEQVAEASIPYSAWASVQNTGDIHAAASAYATGEISAPAYRHAEASAAGVGQTVIGPGEVTANVTNDGTIEAFAYAAAGYGYSSGPDYGTNGRNEADAIAVGVDQAAFVTSDLFDVTTASLTVTNQSNGWIEAGAKATANYAYTATAEAAAIGVRQLFDVDTSSYNVASVVNDGMIQAHASATVHIYDGGLTGQQAAASAIGIEQGRKYDPTYSGNEFNFSVDNSGAILANAQATAYSAAARATGVLAGDDLTHAANLQSDVALHLTYANGGANAEGYISATASAVGETAHAEAYGIAARAGLIDGTIDNVGGITASAYATAYYITGAAHAVGIEVAADVDNATITNKGTIIAYAAGNEDVAATGILLAPYTTGMGTPDYAPTLIDPAHAKIVNDGGTIFAGVGDGGHGLDRTDVGTYYDVWRGNAINVASLTDYQGIEIDLKGTKQAGSIYGDILLGNTTNNPLIVVSDGTTRFNGTIKPTSTFDTGSPYTGTGTLDIQDGGTFKLVLNQDPSTPSEFRYYGLTNADQARVYVGNINDETGGILSIGLSTDDATGHYGQVFAGSVLSDGGYISGDLKGHFIPGLYAANFHATYDSVVNSPGINSGWAFNDVYSNTPLITVTANYRSGHVDLVASRDESNSFENSADTKNQKSVGHSIDSFYSGLGAPDFENPDYTPGDDSGNFNDLIAAIFALDGQKAFDDKMDELSAEPFAQQLNQSLTSFDSLQSLLLDRLPNGGAGGSGGALGYADEKMAANSPASNAIATTASLPPQPKASFWARGIGDWQSQSDPSSAALAYSGSQAGGYIGGDINVGPSTIIGAAAGLTTSSMNFDNGDHIGSNGFQAAGYGRWDGSAWYVRGFGGYGQYSNNSSRYVSILNTVQKAEGTYNTKVAAGYAELGFKGWEGASGGLVPFAGLGATWGSNDAFIEHGSSGDLDVAAASGTRLTSSVGAELVARTTIQGTPFEGILRAAWQHVWTGGAQSVDAAFDEAPVGGVGFTSTSTLAADLAAVTASGTWNFRPMTSVTVQYDGKFGSGFLDTSFSGTVKQQF